MVDGVDADGTCSNAFQPAVYGGGDLSPFSQPYVVGTSLSSGKVIEVVLRLPLSTNTLTEPRLLSKPPFVIVLLCNGHQGHRFATPPLSSKTLKRFRPAEIILRATVGLLWGAGIIGRACHK